MTLNDYFTDESSNGTLRRDNRSRLVLGWDFELSLLPVSCPRCEEDKSYECYRESERTNSGSRANELKEGYKRYPSSPQIARSRQRQDRGKATEGKLLSKRRQPRQKGGVDLPLNGSSLVLESKLKNLERSMDTRVGSMEEEIESCCERLAQLEIKFLLQEDAQLDVLQLQQRDREPFEEGRGGVKKAKAERQMKPPKSGRAVRDSLLAPQESHPNTERRQYRSNPSSEKNAPSYLSWLWTAIGLAAFAWFLLSLLVVAYAVAVADQPLFDSAMMDSIRLQIFLAAWWLLSYL